MPYYNICVLHKLNFVMYNYSCEVIYIDITNLLCYIVADKM